MKRNKILKKPKRTQSFISTVLMFALLLGIFPVIPISISADDPGGSVGVSSIEEAEPFTVPLLPGDLTAEELKEAVLSDADKTAVVSQADIDSLEHVNRLYLQEPDEYTVIFQNRDGGKTVYVFDRPVKTRNANGTYSDMTAAAIVSSTQGGTLDTMGNPQPAAQAISLKAMNEKLTAYKQSRNLNEYQMLDDVYATSNISATGEVTKVNANEMQILPMNSVNVQSVSNTNSDIGGYFFLKRSDSYFSCINQSLAMSTSALMWDSVWLITYCGEAGGYAIMSIGYEGYCIYNYENEYPSLTYSPHLDSMSESDTWDITAVGPYRFTISKYGCYLLDDTSFSSTSVQWTLYFASDASMPVSDGKTYLIRPYASTNTALATKNLLTLNTGSTSNTISLSPFYYQAENGSGSSNKKWDNVSQAFRIVKNNDGSCRITAIMSTNQYNVPFSESGTFDYNDRYCIEARDEENNTLYATYNRSISLTDNVGTLPEEAKWYIVNENGKHYFCILRGTEVLYLSHANNTVSLTETKDSNVEWKMTLFGVDAPAIKQTTDYYCGIASMLQVLMYKNYDNMASDYNHTINITEMLDTINNNNGDPLANTNGFLDNNNIVTVLNSRLNQNVYYKETSTDYQTISNLLISSLNTDYPVIASIYDTLAYYPGGYEYGKHFVCIIGYDPITDRVLISDCIFEGCFGLHIVTLQDLISARRHGFYGVH